MRKFIAALVLVSFVGGIHAKAETSSATQEEIAVAIDRYETNLAAIIELKTAMSAAKIERDQATFQMSSGLFQILGAMGFAQFAGNTSFKKFESAKPRMAILLGVAIITSNAGMGAINAAVGAYNLQMSRSDYRRLSEKLNEVEKEIELAKEGLILLGQQKARR